MDSLTKADTVSSGANCAVREPLRKGGERERKIAVHTLPFSIICEGDVAACIIGRGKDKGVGMQKVFGGAEIEGRAGIEPVWPARCLYRCRASH